MASKEFTGLVPGSALKPTAPKVQPRPKLKTVSRPKGGSNLYQSNNGSVSKLVDPPQEPTDAINSVSMPLIVEVQSDSLSLSSLATIIQSEPLFKEESLRPESRDESNHITSGIIQNVDQQDTEAISTAAFATETQSVVPVEVLEVVDDVIEPFVEEEEEEVVAVTEPQIIRQYEEPIDDHLEIAIQSTIASTMGILIVSVTDLIVFDLFEEALTAISSSILEQEEKSKRTKLSGDGRKLALKGGFFTPIILQKGIQSWTFPFARFVLCVYSTPSSSNNRDNVFSSIVPDVRLFCIKHNIQFVVVDLFCGDNSQGTAVKLIYKLCRGLLYLFPGSEFVRSLMNSQELRMAWQALNELATDTAMSNVFWLNCDSSKNLGGGVATDLQIWMLTKIQGDHAIDFPANQAGGEEEEDVWFDKTNAKVLSILENFAAMWSFRYDNLPVDKLVSPQDIGIGRIVTKDLAEMINHCQHAYEKCLTFEGREELVNQVLALVQADMRQETAVPYTGLSLTIVGPRGSGKSALMAKVASMVYNARENERNGFVFNKANRPIIRPVIIRFCGQTLASTYVKLLLQSVCEQLEANLGLKHKEWDGADGVIQYFKNLMQTHPCIVFLDGLNNLCEHCPGTMSTEFLKDIELHCDSRLIVSLNLESPTLELKDNFWERKQSAYDTVFQSCRVPRVICPLLSIDAVGSSVFQRSEAEVVMEKCLFRAKSEMDFPLSSGQVSTINKFLLKDSSFFVLSLSVGLLRQSVTIDENICMPNCDGPLSVLLANFMVKLEKTYGSSFTRAALGYITFSTCGISDSEMQDLLSLNSAVMIEFNTKRLKHTMKSNTVKPSNRQVSSAWQSMRTELRRLLLDREDTCYSWRYDVVKGVISKQYADRDRKFLHVVMGLYFGNLLDSTMLAERDIIEQCRTHTILGAYEQNAVINHRRCSEATHNMLSGEMLNEAEMEMCNIESICCRLRMDQGHILVTQYCKLLQIYEEKGFKPRRPEVKFFGDAKTPGAIGAFSWVKRKLYHMLKLREPGDTDKSKSKPDELKCSRIDQYLQWIQHHLAFLEYSQANMMSLSCSSLPLTSVARKELLNMLHNSDSTYAYNHGMFEDSSWKRCNTLGNLTREDPTRVSIVGQDEGVSTMAFSPNGKLVATGSHKNIVKIWDTTVGLLVNELIGHTDMVSCLAWKKDSCHILSGAVDGSIRLWSMPLGNLISYIHKGTSCINCIAWSRDCTMIAAGCEFTLRIWEYSDDTKKLPIVDVKYHTGEINSISWCENGKRVATASQDKTIGIWDLNSECVMARMKTHTAAVTCVAWSPVGERLASGSVDGTIILWECDRGCFTDSIILKTIVVRSISWHCNGRQIASGCDDGLRVWDAGTGEMYSLLCGNKGSIHAVEYTQDGRHLAICARHFRDWIIRIFDSDSASHPVEYVGHRRDIYSLSWRKDGKFLASASYDCNVCIWESKSGELVTVLEGHQDGVRSVSWSPDLERMAAACHSSTVIIWNTVKKCKIVGLEGHKKNVLVVAWNQAGLFEGLQLASGSDDRTVRIWNTADYSEMAVFTGQASVFSLAWTRDGSKLAAGFGDKTIRVWHGVSFMQLSSLTCGDVGQVYGVDWSPKGDQLVSGSRDGVLRLWSSYPKSVRAVLQCRASHCVAWSTDGKRLVTGSSDYSIKVWDTQALDIIASLEGGHDGVVNVVCWNPDGVRLASGAEDRKIIIWDMAEYTLLLIFQGHREGIVSMCWNPVGDQLAVTDDKFIRIWDVTNETHITTIQGHSWSVLSLDWSGDGRFLASGSDDYSIRMIDTSNGGLLFRLEAHTGGVQSLVISPDSTKIASGSEDCRICIWDCNTGHQIVELLGHTGIVNSLHWSPCGERLVSASGDSSIRLWDCRNWSFLFAIDGSHTWSVYAVAFSPDGTEMVSASIDNTMRIYSMALGLDKQVELAIKTPIYAVSWSADGENIAYSGANKDIEIWNPVTRTRRSNIVGFNGSVKSIAWSPDSLKIAATSTNECIVRVWESVTVTECLISERDEPELTSKHSGYYVSEFGVEDNTEANALPLSLLSLQAAVAVNDATDKFVDRSQAVLPQLQSAALSTIILPDSPFPGMSARVIMPEASSAIEEITGKVRKKNKKNSDKAFDFEVLSNNEFQRTDAAVSSVQQRSEAAVQPKIATITEPTPEPVFDFPSAPRVQPTNVPAPVADTSSIVQELDDLLLAAAKRASADSVINNNGTFNMNNNFNGLSLSTESSLVIDEPYPALAFSEIMNGNTVENLVLNDTLAEPSIDMNSLESYSLDNLTYMEDSVQFETGSQYSETTSVDLDEMTDLKYNSKHKTSGFAPKNSTTLSESSIDSVVSSLSNNPSNTAISPKSTIRSPVANGGKASLIFNSSISPAKEAENSYFDFVNDLKNSAAELDDSNRNWDLLTGTPDAASSAHHKREDEKFDGVNCIAWSPDSSRLVSGCDDCAVKVWHLAENQITSVLLGHAWAVFSVAWSCDGRTIASCSDDYTVKLWKSTSGRLIHSLEGHTEGVNAVAFSPDCNKVVSVSDDCSVRMWDVRKGVQVAQLAGHSWQVLCVAWSHNGEYIASGSDDQTIRIWNARTVANGSGGQPKARVLTGHEDSIRSLAFATDGRRMASGSNDRTIKIWDVVKGTILMSFTGHDWQVYSVVWHYDNDLLASGSDDRTVRIWSTSRKTQINQFDLEEGVNSIAWSLTNKLAAASYDGTITIIDCNTMRIESTLKQADNAGPQIMNHNPTRHKR